MFGTSADRPNADNVMVIVTDGRSTFDRNQTIPQATAAKSEGITVYAIGVGQADEVELRVSPLIQSFQL